MLYNLIKTPEEFFKYLYQNLPDNKKKYWIKNIIKQALNHCHLNEIEEVNSILYIGMMKPQSIKKNKYKNIDKGWSIIHCGSYDEDTNEEVFHKP